VAAERLKTFTQIFPDARFDTVVADVEQTAPTNEDALLAMVAGWVQHCGPIRAHSLARFLGLPESEVEKVMLRLEAAGAVLRGRFSDPSSQDIEWCDRRLLARIHRLTLGRLRKEIEPVSAAQFMRWVLRWQHLAPDTQLFGMHGTLEVLRQLQGYEAPANAWERQILTRRVAGYDPNVLDQLCLTGTLGWGRLSPHPMILHDSSERKHRIMPTSVAPITFFVRDEADWMIPHKPMFDIEVEGGLSPAAKDILQFLKERGASFFADIFRGTRKLKAEVEIALWELVAAGIITADGFDNLRALIDRKRRAGQGSGRTSRPRHSTGRWSLLFPGEREDRTPAIEATCWMLLKRYGIVFREVLTRESILPRWREVLLALRRLEDRGDVRGGRFVSGFLGEQFALPAAVESLRSTRTLPPTGETITISAADPMNLAGILVPGERVPANSNRFVTFCDGVALDASRPSTQYEDFERAG
jgi:ATP-dependent Lhr-like helicase